MTSTTINEQAVFDALISAEHKLEGLSSQYITELKCYSNPPKALYSIFEGIFVILDPSKEEVNYVLIKKLLRESKDPLTILLLKYDKNDITKEQVKRLTTILDRDECQPERLKLLSPALYTLCLWLHAILDYSNLQQQ